MVNGSIQKTDRKNPWRARYRGPDGRERSRSFRTKVEAERWLRNQLSQTDRGSWVDPKAGDISLQEWSTRWFAGLHDLKPKTVAGYESLLRSRVLPAFGGWKLRSIGPANVREWVSRMVDSGISPARIRQARQVLHATLEQAVVDGLISRNPCDRVKAPTVRPRRQIFLTARDVAVLSEAVETRQNGAGALVLLLAWSGLRWGEAVALKVSAVNLEKRRVRVVEAASDVGGQLVFGTPKTHEARSVIVPRFVADRLNAHMAGRDRDALVFTAPNGGPLRGSNFRLRVWQPACGAVEMPAGLLVHDLRDTAASLMISAGASIKAVQRALGHASAKMTLDTYGSLFEEDLENLADRLEERFALAHAEAVGVMKVPTAPQRRDAS